MFDMHLYAYISVQTLALLSVLKEGVLKKSYKYD